MFTFTNCQTTAFDYFTSDELSDFSLLTGAAGTGKSTLVCHVLRQWRKDGKQVVLTALTHKAAAVAREMLADNHLPSEVLTIHSALSLRLHENKSTGRTSLISAAPPKIAPNSILTIDEASMANDEIEFHVRKAQRELNLKVVYIADQNQLPPVGSVDEKGQMKLSPIFGRDDTCVVELHETVRQPGDSPIVDLARNFITSHTMPGMGNVVENEHGRVELTNHSGLLDRAKELAAEAHKNNDQKHVIVLAHKNASVINYNNKLRAHVWGDIPPYQPGETLIVNDECEGLLYGQKARMFNNEQVVVNSSRADQLYGVDGYRIILKDERELFAAADPNQLIRRHVLIDMGDIHSGNDNDMLRKLCYTAMTRASHSVMLAGHEIFRDQPVIDFGSDYHELENVG